METGAHRSPGCAHVAPLLEQLEVGVREKATRPSSKRKRSEPGFVAYDLMYLLARMGA
jgi:hypothetical protein